MDRKSLACVFCRALIGGAALVALSAPAVADYIKVTNLVTDDQGVNPAQVTDPALLNAWGISSSGTSPFWVSDNGSGVTTLYSVNPATNATTKLGLTVAIPGDGSVTGQVFNPMTGSGAFNGDPFLFASEDGTISGWRSGLGTTAETLQTGSTANVYKGIAFANVGGHGYIYAANFKTGVIDVMKGDAGAPNLAGSFTDPTLPAGYAPFNVENLGGNLFVTYAKQSGGTDEVDGAGLGYVDEFDTSGNLIRRIASNGPLNAPWGLAIAPSSFLGFAGDLLVASFGSGTIDAYDLATGNFVGVLRGADGNPIMIDGLWGLSVGNGGSAGSKWEVYFSAGPNDEADGLFGALTAVPEPGTLALFAGCFWLLRRRYRVR